MSWLEPLAVSFATIALAELADKTQLVCISQACRFSVAPVLAGSALGLITLAAIGVVGGAALVLVMPQWALSTLAGALFIAFGLYVLWRRRAGARDAEEECEVRPVEGDGDRPPSDWRVFGSTFAMVAVAELGDKTQLGVIALTGEFANPWAVFLGASLAFLLASTVAVLGGRFLSKYVESGKLELVAAGLFLVLGAVFLAGVALSL